MYKLAIVVTTVTLQRGLRRIFFNFPLLIIIPPLFHAHLSALPELCTNSIVKLGAWSIDLHLTDCRVNTFSVLSLLSPISWPPLWSNRESSWLQIQRCVFDFRRYQVFWEVVGLERGPLSLVSTTEELLGRKSSGSVLESRDYDRKDPSRWPLGILYPQKLSLTSSTSGGRSVGIVRSRTQAAEFSLSPISSELLWRHTLQGV
jgi:hypothetical protein